MAVTESDLPALFWAWTDPLTAPPDRLAAVHGRIRRHRNRVWSVGAAALCLLVVAGALVAGWPVGTSAQRPAQRRGPSHPALVFPQAFAGSVVLGQVSGTGAQTRSLSVRWPPAQRLGLALRCSAQRNATGVPAAAGGEVQLTVGSRPGQSLSTFCAGTGGALVPDAAAFFPGVAVGSTVTLAVTTGRSVSGPWSVAVLDLDPHWLPAYQAPASYHGRPLRHWFRIGTTDSVSVRLTGADANPVFVLSCGQPGRLSLIVNGTEVGAEQCPDQPWSEQVLAVSQRTLDAVGYAPGRVVSLSFGWDGSASEAGLTVYGG